MIEKIIPISPTHIRLPRGGEDVKRFLGYKDKGVEFQIRKLQQNFRWKNADPDGFLDRINRLKIEMNKSLLFEDKDGFYTYSGLAYDLHNRFKWDISDFTNKLQERIEVLGDNIIPWNKKPPEMRYYQKEAVEALAKYGHAGIELPTGSGKSLIILNLLKKFPVKTLIITPSVNITKQLYEDVKNAFGAKYVGLYCGTSKKFNKLFTVATGQSITRIEKDTPAWEELSKCQMFLADESHSLPSETFKEVCLGIASGSSLRFSVSATQTRTDGSELVLKGITGPIVYRKDFKDLSSEGFLKKVKVKVFKIQSSSPPRSDPKEETRSNLYLNPNVNQIAAQVAEKAVKVAGRQTVILIEEFEQFLKLKNYLNIAYDFVHGTVNKATKLSLPEQYWKCDIKKSIDKFNNGETQCLIGTTAISTGIDLKPVGCLIYLQGGTSEIKVKQGLGRGTRPVKYEDLWFFDFRVLGSPLLERHADKRVLIYKDITDIIEFFGK